MKEYTIQYLQDNDWLRVSAVYDDISKCLIHAGDLLESGHIVRLLARNTSDPSITWFTIEWLDGRIVLKRPVHYCPK